MIEYKGKKYKTIRISAKLKGIRTPIIGALIAPDSLADAIEEEFEDFEELDEEATTIDEQVYHYVPDKILADYPIKDIVRNHLDEKGELIELLEDDYHPKNRNVKKKREEGDI